MKTKSDLERLSRQVGATLEEDTGWRDTRTFQILAPDGKQWVDGAVSCLRVDWAKGSTSSAVKYNEDAYRDVSERIACGLENSTEV